MSFFGLGGPGLKIFIDIDPSTSKNVVQLDHPPSWKIRKNPFLHALKRSTKIINASGSSLSIPPFPSSYDENQYSSANHYAFDSSDADVSGIVTMTIPPGKKYDHLGIKVEFVGRISTMSMIQTENRQQYNFISLVKELAPPGSIYNNTVKFPFEFKNMEKPYETYHGRNCNVSYNVRVLVERKFLPAVVAEKEIIVQRIGLEPTVNEAIKMEVGIEDCLHIEFEYEKRCYHLTDTIIGKIHFLLVKIRIKYMELAVIRRETSGDVSTLGLPERAQGQAGDGTGSSLFTEQQTLVKYEIMDGAPVKGEVVPVRMNLSGIPADLTATIESSENNRFSVRYYLNLVLVDEEDRRYFKQQEIILWRKELGT